VPRKASQTLTEVEQRLMEVLWSKGRASVAEVLDGVAKRPRPAFNTVQTMLRILEQKGYIRHDEVGRGFVYYPIVDKASASKAAIRQLVSRFFDGSAGQLAVNLLSDPALSHDDIAQVERMIAEAKRR
jgi:BlaI family transcriptional regulator, penicillinase repressor